MKVLTPVLLALWIAHGLAGVLAVLLARRRTEHRPIAAFIVVTLVADLARGALMAWGWGPARAVLPPGAPLSGWPRAWHHLGQALLMTWPAGLAVLSLIVFLPHLRRRGLAGIGAVYLATVAALVVTYPANRPALGYAYAAAYLGGVVAVVVGAVAWGRRRAHPRPEHLITLALGVLDLALFAGPFAPLAPAPFERWNVAQLLYLCTWAAIALLHGGFLWGGLMQSPSQRGHFSERLH
jgi:hypothetical protein